MPQVISVHEDAGQRRCHVDRLALAMSWSALTGVHPSDVALAAAGLTTVIANYARPLFRWREFRAFVRLWKELAPGRETESIQHFSGAMREFRSRGKANHTGSSTVLSNAQFSGEDKDVALDKDKPASVAKLTWWKGRDRDNGNCVEVARSNDAVLVRDSKNPEGSILIFPSAEWQAFVNGVKRGDFDDLQ